MDLFLLILLPIVTELISRRTFPSLLFVITLLDVSHFLKLTFDISAALIDPSFDLKGKGWRRGGIKPMFGLILNPLWLYICYSLF